MNRNKFLALLGVSVVVVGLVASTVIGYIDMSLYSSAPGNPNTGYDRLYVTSAGLLCKTSTGASCLATSSATAGGVNLQTASYTAVSGDSGKLISFNCSSACTLTLPASPPSAAWWILTQSIGSGTLTVSRNGLNIDGVASNLALTTGLGVEISTDASNYFTERGMGGAVQLLTTSGTSGAASLSSGVLNIPIYVSGSGGGAFPFTILQERSTGSAANGTSYAITFPQTTASSGNTAWLFCAGDGSQTTTMPAGWTVDINQAQTSFARIMVLHKATASDTSATFTTSSGGAGYACYFMEIAGSHALDQSSTGGTTVATFLNFPAITPTANAVVFALAGLVSNTNIVNFVPQPINPNWRTLFAQSIANSASPRVLTGFVGTVAATNVSTLPPQLGMNNLILLGGSGMAYATFSIL